MKEVYVIYWSSTGNTQAMAEAIGEGIAEAGGKANVLDVSSADASMLKDQEVFALGASAMGAEELDGEMDSFVTEVESFAAGKKIALFGSYDWGDGEWMRTWAERMEQAGAQIVGGEGLICHGTPGADAIDECESLGREVAGL